jgi:hypothetical protein
MFLVSDISPGSAHSTACQVARVLLLHQPESLLITVPLEDSHITDSARTCFADHGRAIARRLSALVWPRSQPLPAARVPYRTSMDFDDLWRRLMDMIETRINDLQGSVVEVSPGVSLNLERL